MEGEGDVEFVGTTLGTRECDMGNDRLWLLSSSEPSAFLLRGGGDVTFTVYLGGELP